LLRGDPRTCEGELRGEGALGIRCGTADAIPNAPDLRRAQLASGRRPLREACGFDSHRRRPADRYPSCP
jgi:hypothetical protein